MSARPEWIQVFLDTPADAYEEAVEFWSAVTAWTPSERRGEEGQFLTLLPRAGAAYVKLQAVDGPAGVHLDLDSADRPATVARARDLGAAAAWRYHDVEVVRSPGGLAFCHTLVDGEPTLVRDGSTVLDQVCLDVPAVHWESEVAFWSELTGRGPQVGSLPQFVRLVEDGRDAVARSHIPTVRTAEPAWAVGSVTRQRRARWPGRGRSGSRPGRRGR